MGGKRSAERAHIHVALEGISASQDTEMPHRWITSSDRAAALQLKPTRWRMPNGSAWPSQIKLPAVAWIGVVDMDKDCEMVASRLLDRWKGMKHPRHQLVANATMDEAFLQAGAMGCP
jgi:hypothetical protein